MDISYPWTFIYSIKRDFKRSCFKKMLNLSNLICIFYGSVTYYFHSSPIMQIRKREIRHIHQGISMSIIQKSRHIHEYNSCYYLAKIRYEWTIHGKKSHIKINCAFALCHVSMFLKTFYLKILFDLFKGTKQIWRGK